MNLKERKGKMGISKGIFCFWTGPGMYARTKKYTSLPKKGYQPALVVGI
jgi:hypothetical protein